MLRILHKDSLLRKFIKPLRLSIALLIVFTILAVLLSLRQGEEFLHATWLILAAALLFYCVFSIIAMILTDEFMKKLRQSVMGYFTILFPGQLLISVLSGNSLFDFAGHKSIILIITFSFMVLISLSGLLNKVIELSESKDEKKLKRENRE